MLWSQVGTLSPAGRSPHPPAYDENKQPSAKFLLFGFLVDRRITSNSSCQHVPAPAIVSTPAQALVGSLRPRLASMPDRACVDIEAGSKGGGECHRMNAAASCECCVRLYYWAVEPPGLAAFRHAAIANCAALSGLHPSR